MPRDDEQDDDDDEEEKDFENPFDFSNIFNNEMFKSKEFQKIFKEVYKKISEFLPQFQNLDPEEIQKWFTKNQSKLFKGNPFVAGFNINFKPDGTPIIEQFGNLKPTRGVGGEVKLDPANTREPLVDINEEEKQLIVIAEMPGVVKEDIELKATSHSLTISTKESKNSRKYYKEIELPCPINSDYAKARYQNGLLEVKLKKITEKQTNISID
ncbi:MAG: Hsp20/alpha crystallin family protein [Candidatus Lokiarchaeota archaeon]|nr:Hsp20/alpha crystallin family protein [Candidatus Lokiarchaeota archaeon]